MRQLFPLTAALITLWTASPGAHNSVAAGAGGAGGPRFNGVGQLKEFESCYQDARDAVVRSEAYQALARESRREEDAEVAALADLDALGAAVGRRLREPLVSLCMEARPEAQALFSARTFAHLIREDLKAWRAGVASGPFEADQPMTLLIVRALLRDVHETRQLAVDAFVAETMAFLRKLSPDADLKSVLNRRFSKVNILNYHPSSTRSFVERTDLRINLGAIGMDEIATLLFHEACHQHPKAAALRAREVSLLSKEEWVYLTLEEEFRASVLTERFRAAVAGRAGQAGQVLKGGSFSQSNGLSLIHEFESFRTRLDWIHRDQRTAVEEWLSRFERKSTIEREAILNRWLIVATE